MMDKMDQHSQEVIDLDTPEIKQVKSFNQRLRNFFVPELKFTEQEEAIVGVVTKLLAIPGTLRYTPVSGPYFLINKELHYFLRIGGGSVTIVNTVDSLSRDVSLKLTDYLQGMIDRDVARDVQTFENLIFKNELHVLKNVETKLDEFTKVSEEGQK